MMNNEDIARTLGRAVRKARKARGLTQANMAEQLEVSVEFYARVERGVARPSIETFACMVDVLNVSADELLGMDPGAAPQPAPLTTPDDSPELCELAEMLRHAPRTTLRVVSSVLNEIDRAKKARKRSRARGAKASQGQGV